MSADAWLIISIAGFSLAGIALIVSVFIFIKMKIISVIGDLSGKTVAREVKALREFNESRGDRAPYTPGKASSLERGGIAGVAHASKKLSATADIKQSFPEMSKRPAAETAGLNDFARSAKTPLNSRAVSTELLDENKAQAIGVSSTELLDENKVPATTVLSGETAVLDGGETHESEKLPIVFKVVRTEIMIHTDEVI